MISDPGQQPPAPTTAFGRPVMKFVLVLGTSVLPGLVFLSGVLASSTHGWEKIANGAAVLALTVSGIRTARLGIFAGPDHLVVRDYFRTYRIGWEEISSFEMPPPYPAWRKAGLRIHLSDGRLISATLYTRGQLDTGRAARVAVEKLEQLRQQRIGNDSADQKLPIALPEQQ